KLIGLVSDNFHNPVFLEIFDLFTRGLQDHGLRPLLVNLSGETDPKNSVRLLRQYSVDGVIVASSTLPTDFAKSFKDAGVPVVHSFGRFSSSPAVHVVGIDNVECGRMAALELAARGYRTVGFLGGPETATSTCDRLTGFTEEMRKYPEICCTHSFARAYSFDAGRDEMIRLLQGSPQEAYFCGDDVLSIGALSAVASAGLCVPEDIGIIGLNDMEMAGWENINLTTIQQPIDHIVRSSIELMEAILEDPQRIPEARLFSCNVVERGTLKPHLRS
ncbi:MAG: substrate-binding domain-containing protein, partial [Halocynthiibacter sp.]